MLTKLAMCERPAESEDIRKLMHLIAPLGLQPYSREQSRNVALVLSKSLDYVNVKDLFTEDVGDP